jgi:hypothetical protein
MKNRLLVLSTLSLALLLSTAFSGTAKARPEPRKAKHVVVYKPNYPVHQLRAPQRLRSGYIWVEGHYRWNKRTRSYQWVNGYLIKKRQNKVWVNGTWRKVHGGWTYTPGFWA